MVNKPLDPYNYKLSTDEQKLVDELLFGSQAVQETEPPSTSISSKRESFVRSDDDTSIGDTVRRDSSTCKETDSQVSLSSIKGNALVSRMKRSSWMSADSREDTPTKSKKQTAEAVADEGRLKKIFEDIVSSSNKKILKTSVVLKHLKNIVTMIAKDGKNENERDAVASMDGIHILCTYVLQNAELAKDSKVVALSITILAYLAKDNDERQELIFQGKGGSYVLSCMRKASTTKDEWLVVHEQSVIALYNFVQYDPNALQLTKTPLALETILRTMKAHKSNHALQKGCFGILSRLAQVDFDFVSKLETFDVCLATLTATKMKSTYLSFHNVGCIFWRQIATLAETEDSKNTLEMMIKVGVLDYLLDLMKSYSNDTFVATNVLGTLAIIGEANKDAIKCLVVANNNLGDIMKIVVKHQMDVDTQREALKFLRLLRKLPSKSLKIPKAMTKDENVRRAFHRAQIDPNRLIPV